MADKEQIKAIIKQYADKSIYNFHKALKDDGKEAATTKYWDGFSSCANLLLLEMDSIQKEPINKDLEKEYDKYIENDGDEPLSKEYFLKLCQHFTNWQKEQMMAKAVDGEVTYGKSLAIPSLGYRLDKERLDFGDKVKVIIIKKD